ncbi:MAG: DUF4062 domain-containing protein [Synergistaceae bacterium]|nr:DUF4062 domain-containing protein [Synergistaceae bacterium]
MEKRYQVFVSSTFNDLQDERRMVFDAIIRKKCFPVGMESFPTLTRDSLSYIKEIIDESDFFILLTGGRYGDSVDDNGTSFTELEYLYAVEIGKPVIPLIMSDWRRARMIDDDVSKTKRLAAFIDNVKTKFDGWKPWNRDDLKMLVGEALEQAIKDHPEAVGWVRADEAESISERDGTTPAKAHFSRNTFVNGWPIPLG